MRVGRGGGEQVSTFVSPQSTFKSEKTEEEEIFQRCGRVLTFLRGVTCFEKVMFHWSSGSRCKQFLEEVGKQEILQQIFRKF